MAGEGVVPSCPLPPKRHYIVHSPMGGGRPAGMQVACMWAATGRILRSPTRPLPLFRLATVFRIDFPLPERNTHPFLGP